MIVYLVFDSEFSHDNVDIKKFSVDFDPSETVDNLKVVISLKYTDLDPNHFDLYLRGTRMDTREKLLNYRLLETETIIIKRAIKSGCCTTF